MFVLVRCMTDHLNKEMRSWNMSRIRGKHTKSALAFADGDSSRGTAHQVKVADVDITHLREKLGLSQDRFAALFGLSSRTVRNWEQGVRHPEGPARILLQVIDREPEAVMRALRNVPAFFNR